MPALVVEVSNMPLQSTILILFYVAARWDLDLIELFCYKFLESIGVGANILFIPNCVMGTSIIYIASELIPRLQTFNSLHFHEG